MIRLVLWGVPVIVSGMTLVYAHKILSRPRTPEVVPAVAEGDPYARPSSPGISDAEVARLKAEIANRQADRRKSQVQARELDKLKRELEQMKNRNGEPEKKSEPGPEPKPKPEQESQPDPEVERLKAELARLKAEAARKSESEGPDVAPRPTAPKPEPAPMKPGSAGEPEPKVPAPAVPRPDVPALEASTPGAKEAKAKEAKEASSKELELQELFEKAAAYRKGRDPKKLLEVLVELQKQRPEDPTVHFGLGEVYASLGEDFDAQKARVAFSEFLSLTATGRFKSESLHKASFVKEEDLKELRSTTREHIAKLRKKHKLLLVTSTERVAKLVAGLEKELKERRAAIAAHKAWIKSYEGRIQILRRSSSLDRATRIQDAKKKIRTLEKAIEREEKQIKFVSDELVMIRRETGYQG